jgi:hypothetical protein
MAKTRFWRIWVHIKQRCRNEKDKQYVDYGGRGIRLEWVAFSIFKRDMYASYLRHVAKYGETNTSIDRRDNDGPYNKKNCRWATPKQQANNTRTNRRLTYRGVTRTISQWAQIVDAPSATIRARLANSWSVTRTLTTPVATKYHNRRSS